MVSAYTTWASLLAALVFATWLNACANENAESKKKEAATSTDSEDPEGDAHPGVGGSPTSGMKAGSAGGTDSDTEDDGSDQGLEEVLAECGADDLGELGPNDVMYEATLQALPFKKKVFTVTATVQSSLKIKVTGSETLQDSLVAVSVDGLFASIGRKEAEKQAQANSGRTTLTNVPISEYSNLGQYPAYDGVVCTVVPATKIDNRRGGYKTVVEFDPPIPSSLSPRASAGRYETELGDKFEFKNMKATVLESNNPDLKGVKELTGSITVEKVATEREVDDGSGGKRKVKGDLAYKVTYSFKNAKTTFALGFPPSVTFYIDHKKRDINASMVDTSMLENGGLVTFLPK